MKKTIYLYISDEKIIRMDASIARNGQHKFYHYAAVAIDDQDIVGEYKRAIAKLFPSSIPSSVHCVLIISRELLIQRLILVPNADKSELKKMAKLQVQSLIPYSSDDYIMDSSKTIVDVDGNAHVLAFVGQKSRFQYFLDPLKKVKVYPHAIIPSSVAIVKSLGVSQKGLPDIAADNESMKVILFSSGNAHEFCLAKGDVLLYSRFFRISSDLLSSDNADRLAEEYINQINNTLEDCRKYYRKVDDYTFYFVSDIPHKQKIDKALFQFLDKEVNSFDVLLNKPPFNKKLQIQPEDKLHLYYYLWLSQYDYSKEMDLVPSETVLERMRRRFRKQAVHTVVLLFFGLMIFMVTQLISPIKKMFYLEEIKANNKGLSSVILPLIEQGSVLLYYDEKEIDYVPLFDLMIEITKLRPKDLVFDMIDINEKKQLVLRGSTLNGVAIRELQKDLLDSALIHGVKLDYVNRKKNADKELVYFQLIGTIGR